MAVVNRKGSNEFRVRMTLDELVVVAAVLGSTTGGVAYELYCAMSDAAAGEIGRSVWADALAEADVVLAQDNKNLERILGAAGLR